MGGTPYLRSGLSKEEKYRGWGYLRTGGTQIEWMVFKEGDIQGE